MLEVLFVINIVVLAIAVGIKEAILWSKTGVEAFKWNEHLVFGVERGTYITGLLLLLFIEGSWVIIALTAILLFTAIHPSAYYEGRKKISKGRDYPKGWKAEPSTTSTAELNLSFNARVILFGLGVGGAITMIM